MRRQGDVRPRRSAPLPRRIARRVERALAVESTLHRATRAYGAVDLFICPSRWLADKLREGGVFPDRVVHIPNFVDHAPIAPAVGAGDGFVYAGRITKNKGLHNVIEAFGRVPGAKLRLFGSGPDLVELERLAEHVAPGQVEFRGAIPPAQVFDEYRRARACVLPSVVPENLPLAFLEAMATARAVITPDLGGSPEVIHHEENGLLVKPDDVEALAEAVRRLDGDPELAARLGRRGRELVVERYGPEDHLGQIEAAYEAAVQRSEERR